MDFRGGSNPAADDEAQFLKAVMTGASPTPVNDNSALLFHVDTKIDYLQNRMENRNERFQEDLIKELNQLKATLRYESRRTTLVAVMVILAGFVAAHFIIFEKVTSYLEQLVTQKTEAQFATEKMQALVANEAQKFTADKAQSLIQSKMDATTHSVDDFKESMSTELKKAEQEQVGLAKLIDSQRASAEKMNDASKLAGDAIRGSYPAYQKLIAQADSADASPLAALWADQLNNLIRTYTRPLPSTSQTGFQVIENGNAVEANTLDADQLIAHMKDPEISTGDREILSSILTAKASSDLIAPAIKAFEHEDSLFVLATLVGHFQKVLPPSIPFHNRDKILSALRDLKRRNAVTQ